MPKTILLCSHSPFESMMIRSLLEKAGFATAATAEDGALALGLYIMKQPDLVLLDAVMPGKNGYYAAKEILEADSSAKIILLYADLSQEQIAACLQLGIKTVYKKPISRDLIDKVQAVLG